MRTSRPARRYTQPCVTTCALCFSRFGHSQRIRYNNLAIASSSVRKLFVYVSSATANTQVRASVWPHEQFDVQSIVQRINAIPSFQYYYGMRERFLPAGCVEGSLATGVGESATGVGESATIAKEALTCVEDSTHTSTSTRAKDLLKPTFHSSEYDVEPEERRDDCVTHSEDRADSTDSPTNLFPLLSPLYSLMSEHKEEIDSSMIRSVSSLLLTHDETEAREMERQLKAYAQNSIR